MKILTRYTIKEVISPFLFGIFAFTSMLAGFLLIDLLEDAAEHQVSFWAVIKLLSLRMPEYIIYAAPLAVLLAALLGLGNLTSHSETIAMRAGGLSYYRLASPVLLVGLLVSLGNIALSEFVMPPALRAYEQTKGEVFSSNSKVSVEHFSKDFFSNRGLIEKRVYASHYQPRNQQLHQALIEEFDRDGRLLRTIEAKIMYWDGQNWFFKDGRIYQYNDSNYYPITVSRGSVHYPLQLTPAEIERANEPPEQKSISELYRYIQGDPRRNQRRNLLVDLHKKMALPFASLIFALVGTPLALKPQRRSNAAGFGLCIIFILIWYILLAGGIYLARAGAVTPFLGPWLPNLVLAGYGVFVFSKVKS